VGSASRACSVAGLGEPTTNFGNEVLARSLGNEKGALGAAITSTTPSRQSVLPGAMRGRAEVVEMRVRERHYTVVGSSASQILDAMGLLGPIRGGVRYGAYTDWEVGWRLCPRAVEGGVVAADARVTVEVVVTLPRWQRPRSAPESLAQRWQRYLAALRRHEGGHVEIAEAAGRVVAERLAALAPAPSVAALELAARAAAELAAERLRRVERDFDATSRHGALAGVTLESGGVESAWIDGSSS
jgi:predicted secreted Zn-dependent protease